LLLPRAGVVGEIEELRRDMGSDYFWGFAVMIAQLRIY
jgi:hypothetical protein